MHGIISPLPLYGSISLPGRLGYAIPESIFFHRRDSKNSADTFVISISRPFIFILNKDDFSSSEESFRSFDLPFQGTSILQWPGLRCSLPQIPYHYYSYLDPCVLLLTSYSKKSSLFCRKLPTILGQ
ncbi:hypothetical protein CDAR_9311 [Caerostris darwini]|uniref:Cytochrome c biogenesis B n=1 Tax=Caerostris darwini TaxID=1538125 RepID=A0AAV4S1S8_9ARAC|nr:hypothetical protein CDAR_9311 [Caerostris darwini]